LAICQIQVDRLASRRRLRCEATPRTMDFLTSLSSSKDLGHLLGLVAMLVEVAVVPLLAKVLGGTMEEDGEGTGAPSEDDGEGTGAPSEDEGVF